MAKELGALRTVLPEEIQLDAFDVRSKLLVLGHSRAINQGGPPGCSIVWFGLSPAHRLP